jgi:hypothetical protein
MMKVEQIPVSQVVLDFELYPREKLDPFNLSGLREALRAGAKFPPVILDRATNRASDGFHRATATRLERGEDELIEVEFRDYPSNAALFEEAMLLNSRHGARLSSRDRTRCALLARELGISDAKTASLLQIRPEKLEQKLTIGVATSPDDKIVPIKAAAVPHLAAVRLTPRQTVGIERSSGHPIRVHIYQLRNALAQDLVNTADLELLHSLGELQAAISQFLSTQSLAA